MIRLIALAAPFNDAGEVLLLKRPASKAQGGLWSFPGGKVAPGENPLEAAVRELREETGLTGRDWRHVAKARHAYDEGLLFLVLFACRVKETDRLRPESTHAWVPLDRLNDRPMPPANDKLVPPLVRLCGSDARFGGGGGVNP